jgi:predicted  nucleic acid-binding Zn-ribbon protein|tara:strand:- start:1607 stop:1774 length:168 start_codon:yes stop_codon:yes gene_type:complete
MDHIRLYEVKLKTITEEMDKLKEENTKIMNELLETRDEAYDWKEKYKELRKTITG